MGRYTGPSCRLCRREGMKLFLKGTKCTSPKCPIEKRNFAPGQHGQKRIRLSDYGMQLREKQKVKRVYGLFERQFRGLFTHAQKATGVTGAKLLELLERRLDNTVYRAGFAASRREARQAVHHRWFRVNGRMVNVPSYQVRTGDVIQAVAAEGIQQRVRDIVERTKDRQAPSWLTIDAKELKAAVARLPGRDDVNLPVQEQLIVELYSK